MCCPSNLLAKDFISLIDSFDLVQLVKSPTHSHGHTLDLVLSLGFSVLDIELGDYSFSDHKPILFTVPLSSPVVKSCKPACMTRIISSTTSDTFSSMFKEFSQSLVSFPSDQSSEELIHCFNDVCTNILDSVAPLQLKKSKPKSVTWLNDATRALR